MTPFGAGAVPSATPGPDVAELDPIAPHGTVTVWLTFADL
jgi:hypothetical protein